MRLFAEIVKDAGPMQVHQRSAIGNATHGKLNPNREKGTWNFGTDNYKFGRFRSQPAKARAAARVNAEGTETRSAKYPDQSLHDDSGGSDMVHGSKSWRLPLEIKKFVPDQQLIFGWASVVEKDGKPIIDKQGDVIPVSELENAAYEFTLNSRPGGDMHRGENVAKLVESMVFTKEKQDALGVNLGMVGWWVGFRVHDNDLWAAHKRGERPEFSIGGAAFPVEVKDEDVK